mmetsp:Transcript_12804/g.40614  ORF Transcript_12804/g.40614 Transcript_12804/m.40614 type:complete len:404 (+) Transcript_12804:465-1676(+)
MIGERLAWRWRLRENVGRSGLVVGLTLLEAMVAGRGFPGGRRELGGALGDAGDGFFCGRLGFAVVVGRGDSDDDGGVEVFGGEVGKRGDDVRLAAEGVVVLVEGDLVRGEFWLGDLVGRCAGAPAQLGDDAGDLLALARRLRRADGDRDATRVVHELAADEGGAVVEAVEEVEEEADDGAGAAVAAPAVEVYDLVGRADAVGEVDRELGDGAVVADAAVLDAKVDEAELAGRVELVGDVDRGREVGPERGARAPLVVGRSRVVLSLEADEGGDALLQDAGQHPLVLLVVRDAREGAHHQPAGNGPVRLVRRAAVQRALSRDHLQRIERRQSRQSRRRLLVDAGRREQGHRLPLHARHGRRQRPRRRHARLLARGLGDLPLRPPRRLSLVSSALHLAASLTAAS